MQVSLHSYSTSTGYHPTIKILGFLARKFYNILEKYYAMLFAESTTHQFKCSTCQEIYTLSGSEAKKAIRPNCLIVFSKKKQFKFTCPKCQTKALQEKLKTTYTR